MKLVDGNEIAAGGKKSSVSIKKSVVARVLFADPPSPCVCWPSRSTGFRTGIPLDRLVIFVRNRQHPCLFRMKFGD